MDTSKSEFAEALSASQQETVVTVEQSSSAVLPMKPESTVIVKSSTVNNSRDSVNHMTATTEAASAAPTSNSGRTAVIHPITVSQDTVVNVSSDTIAKPVTKRARTD